MERSKDTNNQKTICYETNNDYHTFIEQSQQGYRKVIFLFITFVFILIFRTIVLERIIINGISMTPTFTDSDVVITRKYNIEPERYDVVVAKVEGKIVIKRVVGLPEETLQIVDGMVYINGESISNNYDFFTEDMGLLENPYTIAQNEYFLMGDNRAASCDSREFGSINIENIKGIVICRIYPFTKIESK